MPRPTASLCLTYGHFQVARARPGHESACHPSLYHCLCPVTCPGLLGICVCSHCLRCSQFVLGFTFEWGPSAQTHREAAAEQPGNATIDAGRFPTVRDTSSSGLRGANGSRLQTKAEMLSAYRNQLREYRKLQVCPTLLFHCIAVK